jgi:predicted ATPase
MRAELPVGTVTFLFTDIEGSTRLIEVLGEDGYVDALGEHQRLLRDAFRAHGGVEVGTQGDAFLYVFADPGQGLAAAARGQQALASGPVRVRMGLHTGHVRLTREGDDYTGREVHRAARIAATGHGGQIVVSAATRALVEGDLKQLGEHRLKDFDHPVALYQLGSRRFPPLKTISNTNLPRPASSFVGRQRERDELVAMLSNGTRLVTLSGPGGSGKTRLAIEAATELVPAFKAGVFWVGLSALRDPGLVLETVAQALGAKDALAEHIGERELLLLLDNLEQVIEAAPELSGLLEGCPNLRLLCTSRELMRVQGEVEYQVPPLAPTEAIALFCERSRLDSTSEVAELCERLDDLPLAVELAAARTALFSPGQLLAKLSQRLDLLKGQRDADPRQQTLRATIEWSYELLVPEEQALFARLAVFSGGCTYEAVEEIAGADPDILQSLLDKSLLRKRDSSLGPRYWMLETIRQYAAEKLEASGEAERLARRHLAFYLALAEEVDERGKAGDYDVGWIEEERENFRGALDTALELEPEQALDLAGRLGPYWNRRGQWREGRQRLAAALAAAPAAQASTRIRALTEVGNLALWQADADGAEQRGGEALELAREHAHRSGTAYALNLLGMVAAHRGDYNAANERYEESLAEYEAAGDDAGRLLPLQNLASNAISRKDYQRAISLLREKIARTPEHDTYGRALAVGLLGFALAGNGENENARQSFEESLEMSRAHGFSRVEAELLTGLAELIRTASPSKALEYYRESVELARSMGYLTLVAECVMRIAAIALANRGARDAATLLGFLAGFVEPLGGFNATEKAEFDAAIAQARGALGDGTFDTAWAEGCALTLDQAIDLAFTVTASPAVGSGAT